MRALTLRDRLRRGEVYLIRFSLPDNPSVVINKYALNLQEGMIVDSSPTFVCVNLTLERLDRMYPWDVYVSPDECGVPSGAKVIGSQIHTIDKGNIIRHAYTLSEATMAAVDQAIMLGTGLAKYEDLPKAVDEPTSEPGEAAGTS